VEAVKVRLIAWTSGRVDDPRRVIILAIKTSAGKVKEKGVDYYLKDYPEEKIPGWLIEALKFPSVLEHVSFTFMIEGISRVASHQLVRHRMASYTQESQRYSAAERSYVVPETVKESEHGERFEELVKSSYDLYDEMVASGIPYEDARFILPQAVQTRILMTLNLRELIHIVCLRRSPHAQWEIREMVSRMVDEATKVIPELPKMIEEGCRRGI